MFLDMDGVLYRRVKNKQPKLVVAQSLIKDELAENHNPYFRDPPVELIYLKYWWPKMRQSIQEYVSCCDKCHSRKEHQKNKAYYDKKTKERKSEVHDKVYLFCPDRKPGRCHKFRSFW